MQYYMPALYLNLLLLLLLTRLLIFLIPCSLSLARSVCFLSALWTALRSGRNPLSKERRTQGWQTNHRHGVEFSQMWRSERGWTYWRRKTSIKWKRQPPQTRVAHMKETHIGINFNSLVEAVSGWSSMRHMVSPITCKRFFFIKPCILANLYSHSARGKSVEQGEVALSVESHRLHTAPCAYHSKGQS